ncbi:MarR family winged helix-turn-helix transcriptional regulator [Bosea sp. RAC05]|uniref:MarR family winged helix-turn-helix transcriptional regulator n=1 Tax=Bosea sp. RAC05 TaxID=1842539 RepID=UPI0008553A2F|nr:MarR family winged helix-turn-helix transcriptional regulator [Bosea sp. RAC05]AOG03171.1 winged helix DNA-binding domain protein [Bosea sp. RAC05]
MSGLERNGKVHWSDVAVASHRALRSFDEFIQPILVAEGLADLGVANVLFLLNVSDGPTRVVDLVREQRYVGSNASYAISALIEFGLAERHMDPIDKRVRVIELTPRGRKLARSVRRVSIGDADEIKRALEAVSAFESRCVPMRAEA